MHMKTIFHSIPQAQLMEYIWKQFASVIFYCLCCVLGLGLSSLGSQYFIRGLDSMASRQLS